MIKSVIKIVVVIVVVVVVVVVEIGCVLLVGRWWC